MPTYAYRCTACGHQFDVVQRFADDPIRECLVCSAEVRRVIQPVGVVFKGSGWYINDSRKSNDEAAPAKKPDKTETESKKTDTPATDAKKPEPSTSKVTADAAS